MDTLTYSALESDEYIFKNCLKHHLSCYCCGFLVLFHTSICIFEFSYFSAISFGIMGIFLTLKDTPLCEWSTEYLATQ